MLFNYHRMDDRNAGDFWSPPTRYFKFSTETKSVGIWNEKGQNYPLNGDVIIGGGGLLGNSSFEEQLYHICRNRIGKLISWGLGHNRPSYDIKSPRAHNMIRYTGWRKSVRIMKGRLVSWGLVPRPRLPKIEFDTLRDLMNMFDLHGVRDYGYGHNWVPCASCMHPLLDKYRNRPIENEVVVFYHSSHMRLYINDLPCQGNIDMDLEAILEFLSSGQTIITSTYHGAYWGIMLGRKVIVVPWSTRFLGFKYPVCLCHDLLDLRRCLKEASAFPEALEECREVTKAFAKRVGDLLRVEVRRRLKIVHSPVVVESNDEEE